jgi:hypothetical protein
MTYVHDLAAAIQSVPGWAADGHSNVLLSVDFSGIGLGMNDPQLPPPVVHILADALKAAEIPFTIETLAFLAPGECLLVVGNKP